MQIFDGFVAFLFQFVEKLVVIQQVTVVEPEKTQDARLNHDHISTLVDERLQVFYGSPGSFDSGGNHTLGQCRSARGHGSTHDHVNAHSLEDFYCCHPATWLVVVGVDVGKENSRGDGRWTFSPGSRSSDLFLVPPVLFGQRILCEWWYVTTAIQSYCRFQHASADAKRTDPVRKPGEPRPHLGKEVIVAEELFLQRSTFIVSLARHKPSVNKRENSSTFLLIQAIAQHRVEPGNVYPDGTLGNAPGTPRAQFAESGVFQFPGPRLPCPPDTAGIGLSTKRMTAHCLKVRTGVQTGAAADAVERLAKLRIPAHGQAAVINQH